MWTNKFINLIFKFVLSLLQKLSLPKKASHEKFETRKEDDENQFKRKYNFSTPSRALRYASFNCDDCETVPAMAKLFNIICGFSGLIFYAIWFILSHTKILLAAARPRKKERTSSIMKGHGWLGIEWNWARGHSLKSDQLETVGADSMPLRRSDGNWKWKIKLLLFSPDVYLFPPPKFSFHFINTVSTLGARPFCVGAKIKSLSRLQSRL